MPYLLGCIRFDAEVVAQLEEAAVEIRGIVNKLFPNEVLPADVKDTTRSLNPALYSARLRQWLKYPTPPARSHITCQARETAQLLNAISERCSLRFADQQHSRPTRQWSVTLSRRTMPDGEELMCTGIVLGERGTS
ncbi:hypothetical protein K523DRAFT_267135, partial [Schizophyllum commune Tattone D]